MSSSQPLPELLVFKAYWQLQKLLSYMKVYYCYADPKFQRIARLIDAARSAREDEDLARFRKVWNYVVNVWSNQSQVSISLIYSFVARR